MGSVSSEKALACSLPTMNSSNLSTKPALLRCGLANGEICLCEVVEKWDCPELEEGARLDGVVHHKSRLDELLLASFLEHDIENLPHSLLVGQQLPGHLALHYSSLQCLLHRLGRVLLRP